MAGEAYALGGPTPAESYLSIEKLLAVAAESGADAVHPGYGFLAENAGFAQAVLDAGLIWIGPPPAAIEALGDKVAARQIAAAVGAPMAAGTDGPVSGVEEVHAFVSRHGLPIAIKAAFGGGGRGLKVVRSPAEIGEAYESAVREAVAAFGRGECFVEQYLDRPRHVETQCLADAHGNVAVISTRDCSLQRRHQKLVEEAPAPFLSPSQVEQLYRVSEAILRQAPYVGAGTCEFLVGQDGTVSFLETNTGSRSSTRCRRKSPASTWSGRCSASRTGRNSATPTRRRGGTRSSSGSTPRTPAGTSCPLPARSPSSPGRPARGYGWTRATHRA